MDAEGRVWLGGSDLRDDATDALLTNADVRRATAVTPPQQLADLRRPYAFAQVLDRRGQPIISFHDTAGRFFALSSILPHDRVVNLRIARRPRRGASPDAAQARTTSSLPPPATRPEPDGRRATRAPRLRRARIGLVVRCAASCTRAGRRVARRADADAGNLGSATTSAPG